MSKTVTGAMPANGLPCAGTATGAADGERVQSGSGPICAQPNFGLNTLDTAATVLANRQRLAAQIGHPIVWLEQYHGARVAVVEAGTDIPDTNLLRADAVIVNGEVAAAVQVADCVPVLIADRCGQWRAVVHAGRRGIEQEIIIRTVAKFAALSVPPNQLVAAIGPHICAHCYEVDTATFDRCVAVQPYLAARTSWGTPALDLTEGARFQLQQVGVALLHEDGACTYEHVDLHSYRREGGKSGRNVGWIAPPLSASGEVPSGN